MRRAEELGFAALLVIVFAGFVVLGWGYSARVRIVPLTLSIPGLALSVLHLCRTVIRLKPSAEKERRDGRKADDGQSATLRELPEGEGRRILQIWAWIIALALGVNFLGFMIALPVFLLAFIKFFAKRSWTLSTLIAASFVLAVYLVFYVGLKTTL
jgi:hypothetical protein